MKKNFFLLTAVGTLGSIVLTLIYMLIMSLISRLVFSLRFGDEAVFATMGDLKTYVLIAFVIIEIIFFVWLFSSMSQEQGNKFYPAKKEEKKSGIVITKATKVCAACAGLLLAFMIVANVCIYTEFSKDSIKQKNFFSTKEYTWDKVYFYTLSCDENADITFSIETNDKTVYEILGSVNSCSDKFTEEFGDILSYASYVSDILDSQGEMVGKKIEGREYFEKFYSSDEKVWAKIQSIIE